MQLFINQSRLLIKSRNKSCHQIYYQNIHSKKYTYECKRFFTFDKFSEFCIKFKMFIVQLLVTNYKVKYYKKKIIFESFNFCFFILIIFHYFMNLLLTIDIFLPIDILYFCSLLYLYSVFPCIFIIIIQKINFNCI